jgi:hypothetical protein
VIPKLEQVLRQRFAVTAAIASDNALALVTVHWTGQSRCPIPSASETLAIQERDLTWPGIIPALELFMIERGVLQVAVRRSGDAGIKPAAASGTKLKPPYRRFRGPSSTRSIQGVCRRGRNASCGSCLLRTAR